MSRSGTINHIAVIGATGMLGIPVVKAFVRGGYAVRGLVRDLAKAKKLLPPDVGLVEADLRNPDTLISGLQGQDAVYINLQSEADQLGLPWYEEREGVASIVEAAKKNSLRHIYKIGTPATYPEDVVPGAPEAVPNIIRLEGNKFIENSGVSFTFFDPSIFFDNIAHNLKGDALQWIGDLTGSKRYWIAGDDFAKQVLAAINNPKAENRHFIMQGPELLTTQEVFDRFKAVYNPAIKVQTIPLWMMKPIGLFSPKMRYLGHLFRHLCGIKEELFKADETWAHLGRPSITVEEYATAFKESQHT